MLMIIPDLGSPRLVLATIWLGPLEIVYMANREYTHTHTASD